MSEKKIYKFFSPYSRVQAKHNLMANLLVAAVESGQVNMERLADVPSAVVKLEAESLAKGVEILAEALLDRLDTYKE